VTPVSCLLPQQQGQTPPTHGVEKKKTIIENDSMRQQHCQSLNIEYDLHQKAHVQRSPMYQCPASLSRISYNTVPEGLFNTVDTAYFASYVWETPKNPLTAPRVPALAPGFSKKVIMKL